MLKEGKMAKKRYSPAQTIYGAVLSYIVAEDITVVE